MRAQWALRAALTEVRRAPRGDSPHLHQTEKLHSIEGGFSFVFFIIHYSFFNIHLHCGFSE